MAGRLKDDRDFLPASEIDDGIIDVDDDDDVDVDLNVDELDLSLSFDDLDDDDLSLDDHDHLDPLSLPVMDGKMEPKNQNPQDDEQMMKDQQSLEIPEYILGTLIVRIAAARDLKPSKTTTTQPPPTPSSSSSSSSKKSSSRRKLFLRHTSNTYAVLGMGNQQMQRTSTVDEATNPTWNRTEPSMFFDVTLPITNLVPARHEHPPKQILTVSLFHTDVYTGSSKGGGVGGKSGMKTKLGTDVAGTGTGTGGKGASNDPRMYHHDDFVGMASIDVTPVLTGKLPCIDQWLPLTGIDDMDDTNSSSSAGSARLIIEYECADDEPRPGDKVRFTGFVTAALCPVPRNQIFKVEQVYQGGEEIVLSYITPLERWRCRIKAHRYMLISVERHVTALEGLQEELMELTTNLIHSPVADVVVRTIQNLPHEGLVNVGVKAAVGGVGLLQRWTENGLDLNRVLGDIVFATNLDGKQTPDDDDSGSGSDSDRDSDDDLSMNDRSLSGTFDDDLSVDSDSNMTASSGMPCCPISGEPMRHPVVAADGHTYDRSSIKRWLRRSNMSPLTGTELKSKDLIPNYLLISTFQKVKRVSASVEGDGGSGSGGASKKV